MADTKETIIEIKDNLTPGEKIKKDITKYIDPNKIINNPWKEEDEKKITELINKAKKYRYMYKECSNHYYILDIKMMVPTLLVAAIIVALNSISLVIGAEHKFWLQLTTILCSLFATVLYGVEKRCKFSQKVEKYYSQSIAFLELINLLQTLLAVPKEARGQPYTIIYDTNIEMNKLLKAPLFVPKYIENNFEKYRDKILAMD